MAYYKSLIQKKYKYNTSIKRVLIKVSESGH